MTIGKPASLVAIAAVVIAINCDQAVACKSDASFEFDKTIQSTLTVRSKETCTWYVTTKSDLNYAALGTFVLKPPRYGIASVMRPLESMLRYQAVRRIPAEDNFTVRQIVKLASGIIAVSDLEFSVKQE